jgi:ABC-2 type transport system permease protein
MMPSFLQKVGTLTPQYWAHESLQAAMNGTLEGSTFFTSAIILLGFSIACFIIAGGCYPRFLKRAKN